MKTIPIVMLTALVGIFPVTAENEKKREAPKAEERKKPGKPQPGRGLGGMSLEQLQKQLAKVRGEHKKVVADVNQSHDTAEALKKDRADRAAKLKKLKAEAAALEQAITHLGQKAAAVERTHEKGHAREEELRKLLAALETELERREEISALEKEAAELSRKAEALRKKAEQLKN